jgi:hypothetical protein
LILITILSNTHSSLIFHGEDVRYWIVLFRAAGMDPLVTTVPYCSLVIVLAQRVHERPQNIHNGTTFIPSLHNLIALWNLVSQSTRIGKRATHGRNLD